MMFWFYLRSLFSKYGWLFIRHVALFRPGKVVKAFFMSLNINSRHDLLVKQKRSDYNSESGKSIVGIGFCMKPKDPPCPSLNDLHGCRYFEEFYKYDPADVPKACSGCYIKKAGTRALYASSAFYIMTSAKDILFDVYKPALNSKNFDSGVFIMCAYSFKPFFIAMYSAGLEGRIFPFCSGDCRDYSSWIKADRGEKPEQTKLVSETQNKIELLLSKMPQNKNILRFEKKGNIFYPS